MYINPFIAGILFILGVEISALFVAALVMTFKRGKRK